MCVHVCAYLHACVCVCVYCSMGLYTTHYGTWLCRTTMKKRGLKSGKLAKFISGSWVKLNYLATKIKVVLLCEACILLTMNITYHSGPFLLQ